ncbi:hypothetical protein CHUAL_003801 [Chamberlinius hualienensis]
MENSGGVFPLHCIIQHYAWGKLGSDSEVSQLISNVRPDFKVDETKPYAELWMGTHHSGPSNILMPDDKTQLLSSYLSENHNMLGKKVIEMFGVNLPFLFKVLSINIALSIQAHPDKKLAEKLHKLKPDLYKDGNHKPELTVALTPFEALCGFRPFQQICDFIKNIPQLNNLIGSQNVAIMTQALNLDVLHQKRALKEVFSTVMTATKDNLKEQLNSLVETISIKERDGISTDDILGKLFMKLYKDFPGDVGCFGIYFLNYLRLEPGEALYLEANEAHAYLSGDCMEIMACSDNTVRAGLTPKFIDVQVLCDMLTYEFGAAESKLFPGAPGQDIYTTIYDPPVPDFTLAKTQLPSAVASYTFPTLDCASILIFIKGQAKSQTGLDIVRGTILFVGAGESLEIASSDEILVFRGYCQL